MSSLSFDICALICDQLPMLLLLLPLLAGVAVLLLLSKGLKVQRIISLVASFVLLLMSVVALQYALNMPTQVYALGNWQAPFGIVLVLDSLSALMVLLVAILAVAALWFAIRQNVDAQGAHFHSLFQIQLFGLNGAFLTGDLFNLFVFFEVLLLASYGLLLHGGGRLKTKAGLHYVTLNLVGSTLFLFAVGALYGILGTLNIADLGARMANLPAGDQGVVALAGILLLFVFGLKAAIFPLYLWLPQAYAQTSAPVAALFAIMTKVGIYSMIRVHGTLFGDQAGELAGIHQPWLLWLGGLTLVLAAFGVLAARGLREQVAYLVLASVATLLVVISLPGVAALSGALFYLIHSTLVAAGLFLLAEWIRQGRGVSEDQFIRAPAMPKAILVGSLFMFAAIAMSGLPPLSGFFGKLLILSAALEQPEFFVILAAILISSLLMIMALARSGSLLFYHALPAEVCHDKHRNHLICQPTTVAIEKGAASVAVLFSTAVLLVVFANPVHQTLQAVAAQTLDRQGYQQTVLSYEPVANPHKTLQP